MCGRSSCQTPGADDGVGLRRRHAGPHQAGRAAVRGLEHRVHLGLHGGRVLLQVDAEGQQPAGGRPGRGATGRSGHRQQHRARPEVGPAAYRNALQRAPGQDAASSAAKPSRSAARRRRAGSGSIAETTCAAPETTSWSMPCHPARARSDSQERAAGSRFAAAARRRPARSVAARARPVASSTRASSASWTEPSSAVRAAARATKWSSPATARPPPSPPPRRPGRPAASPRRRRRAGQAGGLVGPGAGRPATSARSKASTAARASSSPRWVSASSRRASATALVGGNHCISGNGAVVGGQFQVGQVAQEPAEDRAARRVPPAWACASWPSAARPSSLARASTFR